MKTARKIIAALLCALMLLPLAVPAFAASTNFVTFKDLLATVPGNDSFKGDGQSSFEFGNDYWFEIISLNGEKYETPLKVTAETTFTVNPGRYIEFIVGTKGFGYTNQMNYMHYVQNVIEATSIKVLAFKNTDAAKVFPNMPASAKSDNTYYINGTNEIYDTQTIYAVKPEADMTVGISEYDMKREAFLPKLPTSKYYSVQRVQYVPSATISYGIPGNTNFVDYKSYDGAPGSVDTTVNDRYPAFDHGNTKVTYIGETFYIAVRLPLKDSSHEYKYNDYKLKVNYMKLDGSMTSYEMSAGDRFDRFSENGDYLVDIFKIEGMKGSDYVASRFFELKVSNTVTFSFSMIKELVQGILDGEFALDDLGNMDLSPIVEWITRFLVLIRKIFAGFGA